jgi:hypothetical protein
MRRYALFLGMGITLLAANACSPAPTLALALAAARDAADTVRALLAHDPTLTLPDTIAGHNACRWAQFHGCADVLTLLADRKG